MVVLTHGCRRKQARMNFVTKDGQQPGIPARPGKLVEGGGVRSLGGSLLDTVGGGRGTGIDTREAGNEGNEG